MQEQKHVGPDPELSLARVYSEIDHNTRNRRHDTYTTVAWKRSCAA